VKKGPFRIVPVCKLH